MGNLRDFIVRRTILILPTLIGISIITFAIINLAPGGPLNFMLENAYDISPQMILYWKQQMGLDQPLYIQYFVWLKNIITGNLGRSYISQLEVSELIKGYWLNTLTLSLTSLILSLFIAIPLGVISAVKKDSLTDNISRFVALFGVSMPNFWTGILLIYIFSLKLNIFPTFGAATIGGISPNIFANIWDRIMHLILPVIVLAFGEVALMTRLVRSSMLDVLNQEYIMTARAKGVMERIVIYKHALRNALLPVVTLVGLSVGWMLSGSVTVETVFSWPGLGRYMVDSTFFRDYPAIMAMTLIVSVMVVISNLVTDVAYGFLDPRIRY